MPLVNISTSIKVENTEFLQEITTLISSLTNKPERFVMAKLEDDLQIHFGDKNPCCLLEIKSIGAIKPSEMVMPLSSFIYETMGIPLDKIYIYFEDVPASMWAWNGKTFG